MKICICETCLTRDRKVTLTAVGEPCLRCGDSPTGVELTTGDIRRIIRGWHFQEKKR